MGLESFAPERDTRVHDGPRCLVVMYHYVQDRPPNSNKGIHALSPNAFRDQLDMLSSMLQPIEWPTLHRWLIGEGSIPQKCFLLTFDDGLSDHVRHVLPILRSRKMRGLFFVPGGILSGDTMLPAHALHLLIEQLGVDRLKEEVARCLTEMNEGQWLDQVNATTAQQMYHYEPPNRAWFKYLVTMVLPLDVRARVLDTLFRKHVGEPAEWAKKWYLSADDVRNLQADKHSIGGHGFTHEPLGRLSAEEQVSDLKRSFESLVGVLGRGNYPFSFPYGSFDEGSKEACESAGFAGAFTTQSRWCNESDKAFQIPRIDTINVEVTLRKEAAWEFV